MAQLIKADIHIHTCLSPCADVTQSPLRIVRQAYIKGLNMIFITDHNTMQNAEAAIKANSNQRRKEGLDEANDQTINVFPGMEITTKEEVHILALFEKIHFARMLQNEINAFLPDALSDREFSQQVLANEFDEVEGFYQKSLFNSVNLSLNEVIERIHYNNGIAVAAHIDRPSFSIISQLGFVPEDCKLDALEISPNISIEQAKIEYSGYAKKYKFVKGSDSHSLNLIGTSYTEYFSENNSFDGFVNYLFN
ncbi:MAG: PHP domain-containing protein [Ignavibacteria bacterium]|nr:PHP domain-containing protein [Ignavibacteria bacterium]